MATISWPWAIVLCRFRDRALETQPVEYYVDLFTRNGTGGVCDYWRTVTCGTLDLTGSRVFGWLEMAHDATEVAGLTFPGDRATLFQWGIDAADAAGIDRSPFKSTLVVHNFGVDHGATGAGILIVHQDAAVCEYGFICHEMGHGHGLPHSFAAPNFEYGDGFDLMSFATTTRQFPVSFRGATGVATVGLNGRNVRALKAMPFGRMWDIGAPDFSDTVVLDPLSQPLLGSHGHLLVHIAPRATCPARANGTAYSVEFRRRAGWDQAIAGHGVIVHELRSNGHSYLHGGLRVAGDEFVTPAPEVHVRVTAVDSAGATATVRVWDLPEGAIRKEDSSSDVYVLVGGQKRLVDAAGLASLDRTAADVRAVPDGALAAIPTGAGWDGRRVTAIIRDSADPGRRIDAIAGTHPGGRRWQLSADEALAALDAGQTLYVEQPAGDRVLVEAATTPQGTRFVRTQADGDIPNNLLALPDAINIAMTGVDCIPYDPARLRIVDEGALGWLLTDGRSRMLLLDTEEDAIDALALAKRHTAQCFIGRNNQRANRNTYVVQYWSGDSGRRTDIVHEDAIRYNADALRIVDEGPAGWLLTDGQSRMLMLDTRADAENALALARRHNRQCFIGRNNQRANRDTYVVSYWLSC